MDQVKDLNTAQMRRGGVVGGEGGKECEIKRARSAFELKQVVQLYKATDNVWPRLYVTATV